MDIIHGVLAFLFAINGLVLYLLIAGKLVSRQAYTEIVYLAVKGAIKELRDEGYL